jgi:DNA-binding NarL/FixJ family response regulator
VLAEDSVLLREGMARLLEDSGFAIVGQSGTAEDLLLKVRSYSPDIAIVDIRMPPTHSDEGLRAAKEIRDKHPETAVLVLSQYVEQGYALELLQESAEGVGYLLKDRVYDWPTSSRRSGASPRAGLRSIPPWSRSWSAGDGATIRSTI